MNAIDRQHLNEVAADEAHDIGLVKRDALRSALAELDRLEGSFRLAVRRKQETQAEADRQRMRAEAHAIVNSELHEMIRELRAKLDGHFAAILKDNLSRHLPGEQTPDDCLRHESITRTKP